MGRVRFVCRLAIRDLARRPGEAALLVLAMAGASTALTLALVLHGVISQPYQDTRAATTGPDVVADVSPLPFNGGQPADLAALDALLHSPGVVAHSGPFPLANAQLVANGNAAAVQVVGRDVPSAGVDQPKLTQGQWVRAGGVVVERSFADAIHVHPGDSIKLNGHSFRIVGLAVTAAMPAYPLMCLNPCQFGSSRQQDGPAGSHLVHPNPGLIWAIRADIGHIASDATSVSYLADIRLAHPADATAFVKEHDSSRLAAPVLESWQDVRQEDADLVINERRALLAGSWLLVMLAFASVTVLVGGRIASQIRRVGLLKAIGGTPALVAAVLLTQYIALATFAAASGLAAGLLSAPLLTQPSTGLIGGAGTAPVTATTIALVLGVAMVVTVVATIMPAASAARLSSVAALADSARPPRRIPWLMTFTARLPIPLLIGLRIAARRPRRALLNVASIAVTVGGIVAVLAGYAQLNGQRAPGLSGLADPRTSALTHVLLLITLMLVLLAAVNAIFITWATVLDAKHASALARALGATPGQVSAGLSTALVLPALGGAIIGIPAGLAMFAAVNPQTTTTLPPLWWLLTAVPGTVATMAALTALPARLGARRPIVSILQSESP